MFQSRLSSDTVVVASDRSNISNRPSGYDWRFHGLCRPAILSHWRPATFYDRRFWLRVWYYGSIWYHAAQFPILVMRTVYCTLYCRLLRLYSNDEWYDSVTLYYVQRKILGKAGMYNLWELSTSYWVTRLTFTVQDVQPLDTITSLTNCTSYLHILHCRALPNPKFNSRAISRGFPILHNNIPHTQILSRHRQRKRLRLARC